MLYSMQPEPAYRPLLRLPEGLSGGRSFLDVLDRIFARAMQVYREVMREGNGRGRVLWDGNFRCRKWACVTGSLQAFPLFGGVSEPDACGSADGSARLGTEGARAAGMIRRARSEPVPMRLPTPAVSAPARSSCGRWRGAASPAPALASDTLATLSAASSGWCFYMFMSRK